MGTVRLDDRKRGRILEVLSFDFATPKRYSELWTYVSERRGIYSHTKRIGSKSTLNQYLDELEEKGVIVRDQKSRKNVTYALADREKWKKIKNKYKRIMFGKIEKFESDARNTIHGINKGDIPKEKIEAVILNAWRFYVNNSTDAFKFLVDARQNVSYVASSLLMDWVMLPFKSSAKVVEACYSKYPSETDHVLNKLRNIFPEQKKLSG